MPVMHWRWKVAIVVATGLVAMGGTMWANLGGHYWLILPIGFLSSTVPFSVGYRFVIGRWPPWGKVWRMFRTGGREIE